MSGQYISSRTWFYGIVCPHCDLVFGYPQGVELNMETPIPCPRCGIDDPDSEPTQAEAFTVLSRATDPNLHISMIEQATALVAGIPVEA